MTALFGNLKDKTKNMEAAVDRIGGGGYILDSDIYPMTLKMAYVGTAKSGATFISTIFTREGSDTEYREDLYITSGDEKGNLPYYVKNDKNFPLPGYTIVSDLCLVLGGVPLEETSFEEKTVNVYDMEAKKELPKSVMVPVDIIGKQCLLAIQKSLETKQVKGNNGEYVDSDETRETNNIEKVIDLDSRMTVVEAMANATEPVYHDTWLEKNKGKVYDKTKKKGGKPSQGTAGAPPKAGGAAQTERPSLFGKKK